MYYSWISALLMLSFTFVSSAYADKHHYIKQKDIPVVIDEPGEYILKDDICYRGSDTAITIASDDVKLNLRNFSITLTNPNATGILITDVSEIIIESDTIINTSNDTQSGYGIHIVNANKVLLSDIFTEHHFDGLFIETSSDVTILNSQFLDPSNAGAEVFASVNVKFDGCVFTGSANNGLLFDGANQDCTLINSDFPDAEFTNLLVQQINGMMVDNCSFTNIGGDSGKPNLVQFGDVNTDQVVNDLIFTNCTLVNRPPSGGNTAPEGLGLYNVSGVLVDSCVIDIDNTDQLQEKDLSGIHVGNGSGIQVGTNVIISNTICQGPATDGFYPDVGCTNVVIDSCVAANAQKDGIFLAGTAQCVVKNCTVVNNGTNGIFIGESVSPIFSMDNAVINNVVSNNGFNIITPISDPSLPPTGNGIAIAFDTSNNLILENHVFDNAVNGIDIDGSSNNLIIDNQVFNNLVNGIVIESGSTNNLIQDNQVINNVVENIDNDGGISNILINNTP